MTEEEGAAGGSLVEADAEFLEEQKKPTRSPSYQRQP